MVFHPIMYVAHRSFAPLLLRFEIFSGYTIHILSYAGLSIMAPRVLAQRPKTCGVGLSRLCSATFEQLLAFGATFCGFSNLEQVLPFRAIFEQNIGLEYISSTKKSTISWKTLHLAHSKSPPSKNLP